MNESSHTSVWNRLPKPVVRRLRTVLISLVLPVLFSLMSLHVEAHDPGLSAVDLQVEKSGIAATLTLALADVETLLQLDLDRDGEITTAEIAAARSSLEALASSSLEVRIDERPSSPTEVEVRIDESNAVHFRLRFEKEHDSHLSVRSLLIAQLPRGHRQYMAINDSAGNRVAERVLDAKESGFQLSLDEPTASIEAPRSFSQFLLLGIEHILTGYDHLVFLLGLLIAGVSFRSAAGIITSFTVAHSVTLALATLDIVRIPSGVVEPLIAVSIVYVGVENISRRELNRRWLLTFGFGLIHGFGFASVLNELGVASSGAASAAVPLLSFNLGVELGQIAIAAVVWPVIWKLREKPSFVSRFVPACSVLIALAGGLWLIERTMLK